MAEQITKQELEKLFTITASNFKFKMNEGFEMIFNIIYSKISHLSRDEVQKKFEQLLLTPNEEWNKKYGFAGYPALSDWISILSGERPLSDFEKIEANKKHEEKLRLWVGYIINWINDPNLDVSFKRKYADQYNFKLKVLINKYSKKIPENETDTISLGQFLKRKYDADKIEFKARLKSIAENENPLPFVIEFKPQIPNLPNLPTLKKG